LLAPINIKMTKKKTKKEKEEYELKFEQNLLEQTKNTYNTYLKALVKYNLSGVVHSAIFYNEFYHKELLRLMEKTRDCGRGFMSLMFGLPRKTKPTELELVKEEIVYYNKLIKQIGYSMENWTDDIKMKVAKDAVEKKFHWMNLYNVEKRIVEEIKESKKVKKKEKLEKLRDKAIIKQGAVDYILKGNKVVDKIDKQILKKKKKGKK